MIYRDVKNIEDIDSYDGVNPSGAHLIVGYKLVRCIWYDRRDLRPDGDGWPVSRGYIVIPDDPTETLTDQSSRFYPAYLIETDDTVDDIIDHNPWVSDLQMAYVDYEIDEDIAHIAVSADRLKQTK